ncbi:hypothetical protein [Algoriphagus sanaruensis]|uniref:Uncharacterized protein n=1 Tax=Algoriphagus sanaruensis TaxID=1727163 RepID=A0A142ERL7_9BACT|nr:hypothetical protein [Algoriphagus sanaruensis]AMQ57772.1 hypothetical protein AO498_15060 [Algoriphagus sanaruensis]
MKTRSKKSPFTSLAWSFLFIYLYYLATVSWVKMVWNHEDSDVFFARIKLLMSVTFFGSIFYIVGIYNWVGHNNVDPFFDLFIVVSLTYLGIGLMAYPFLQKR